MTPLAAAAQEGSGPVAAVSVGGAGISFQPVISAYESLKLTVTGPGGFVHEEEFGSRSYPSFSLFDAAGENLVDGSYTWELRAAPWVSGAARKALQSAREYDRELSELELSELGLPPAESLVQSGHFRILGGGIVTGDVSESSGSMSAEPTVSRGLVTEGDPTPLLITGDLTVHSSLCVGIDCATAESYGADTIRLKENNLRIHFDDTSSSGSFPNRDWRIVANDQANGGANYFGIEDATAGNRVFTLEAAAPSNSLVVDATGRVGLGTSTPVLPLDIVNGNTPGVRLNQDGSSGFTPQTWDIAGNESGFFVRDATNGSTLPFRILPGAASATLVIDGNDEVGIGAGTNPRAKLHVQQGGTTFTPFAGTLAVFQRNAAATDFAGMTFISGASSNGQINFGDSSAEFQGRIIYNIPNAFMALHTNGAEKLRLLSDGSMTSSTGASLSAAGAWINASTRAAKENIRELSADDARAALQDMSPVRFNYKREPGEEYVGFIAEDVPELVAIAGRDGLSPMDIVAVLTKVLQEQQRTIDTLAAKVGELERSGR
jgi:hypothetical protein